MPQVELRVVSGKQNGSTIALQMGKFLIGREHDCHLRPNSELISRHHCAFTVDEYAVQLRDLGSRNGTFVNGEPIRGVVMLQPGDRVTVGKLEFEVVIEGQPAPGSQETAVVSMGDTATIKGSAASSSETVPEIDATSMLGELDQATPAVVPADEPTAVEEFSQVPPAGAPPELPASMPPGSQPPMPAGVAAPYPPGAAPWMGAPQFPYPGYPQYPAMPYGYGYPYPGAPGMPPPGAMMVPGQPPAGYPYPQPPQPAAPAPAAAAPASLPGEVAPGIRLPDPSTTGAKDPEPSAPKAAGAASGQKHIPSAAQDVINSYLQRRPKT